ncbi:hypothetical protein [Clostridium tagluense]|uniref:Cyclic nucleotide-binding domain-containing protein n=1 Tax=Clostridium tagluense TaxID=360422 RepID=A0A401UT55_9CLOT|nr:hypothetical protein [Clostridium tagluense]GCD12717.1 hypothetical protein Ctaglu_43400 [Clostridium tagluense]
MLKMKKLFGYMLVTEEIHRVGTQEEINQMVIKKGFPVWVQTLVSRDTVFDWICEGGEVEEGFYVVSDGVIEVTGEEEDYEIILISNLKAVI